MVRQPADIVLLGVLRERDADKTDLQIVPSTRQCNLTWCEVFSPPLSVGPPSAGRHNGEKTGTILNVCFARKRSSRQNVHLYFCSSRNCLRCGNNLKMSLQNIQRYSDGLTDHLITRLMLYCAHNIDKIKMAAVSTLPHAVQKWSQNMPHTSAAMLHWWALVFI